MPSHVAGKPDNSHGATDQARLPGVCLILPLQKEKCSSFLAFIMLPEMKLTKGFRSRVLRHLQNIYSCLVLVWSEVFFSQVDL